MRDKIFYKKIEKIVEKESPYGILLIGSLSRMDELDFESVRDVDLFVIREKEVFEREVIDIDGLEFDISYLPLTKLIQAVEDQVSSIISVLAKSKILYSSKKDALKSHLKVIKSIYEQGPNQLSDLDIDYERFKLTQNYLTLKSRVEDSLNFNFLKGVFIKDLVHTYFKLNNMWMPPDKRALKSIKDRNLIALLEVHLNNNSDNLDQIEALEKTVDYVLEAFGGRLNFWKRDKYPFDFL